MASNIVTSGKKRRRSEATSATLPISHSLFNKQFISLQIPEDSSFIDVYVALLKDCIPAIAAEERESTDCEVVAYSQGRKLTSHQWQSLFSKASKECDVTQTGKVDAAGPSGLYFALLRFPDASSANKAVTLPGSFPDTDGDKNLLGLKGWLAAHQSHSFDARALQAAVDKYVSAFDVAEEATESAKTELDKRMNSDGFTLVTRTSKKTGVVAEPGDGVVFESDNMRRKKKRGTLLKSDFYSFQRQVNKFDKLSELRAKFADDKERLTKIKEARKFKPY